MMLLPDLYQLCGPCYGSHQNVYALSFPDKQGLILFDTGLDESDRKIIDENFHEWGLDAYKINHVFLTHSHFDHTGNAAYYAGLGARIFMAEADASAVESGSAGTISYCYGLPFPVCSGIQRLSGGDEINTGCISIKCYSVPGHTPGSMAYGFEWQGKNVLVTGDFLQTGTDIHTPVLGIRVDERYCYEDYCLSLKKMTKLSCDIILPGHFRPCMKNGSRLLGAGYREILVNRDLYKD